MIANGCAQQPGPLSKSAEVCIGGVSTRLIATAYANRIFVVVSQRENLGTLISATRESATGLATGLPRDSLLGGAASSGGLPGTRPADLLLALNLLDSSRATFHEVMRALDAIKVW
ncbi:hypothetical protein EMIHUDRAFT_220440 [Emiliania huxleyi CCMP1516]|uniref:Proteasome assembly chaperone 3 n=2 Tax=Emiliania huxleyi TaxID=2903 RepID=A0A0D3I147_EMIH1|nr:hypothetical protein EMIHUDRAFT_220440 [Emiliania huxleyi CCMP1516]EOD04982.1 hypothetical protein EMIHUDRAFT_220440 [Emiliania huxleyi CCMP1516]|eukprot:XP_005757411.1 hypothetical protein EMIHUDRAFT_220440 [Emiliania huxleyi CCMP1516]